MASDAVQRNLTPRKRTSTRRAAQHSPTNIVSLSPPAGRTFEPTPEQIARRAYEIWLERGREHGRDREHWLEAERQLRQQPTS